MESIPSMALITGMYAGLTALAVASVAKPGHQIAQVCNESLCVDVAKIRLRNSLDF